MTRNRSEFLGLSCACLGALAALDLKAFQAAPPGQAGSMVDWTKQHLNEGFWSADSLFLSALKYLKQPEDLVRIATGFGGGMLQKDLCGYVTGGVMAIGLGLINYNPRTDNPEARKVVTAATKQFYRWFEAEIGHARCYDIRDSKLGRFFDASDPEENRKFIAAGGQELCAGIVGKSARKAAEMILAARQK